jgi:nucleoside-diphosphate-sugar epimerase
MVSTTLVLGATGSTGRRVVEALLEKGQKVHVIVRSKERMEAAVGQNSNLNIIESTVLNMSDKELSEHIEACDSIVSCLGHNMTFKGMFGKPRRLVTDTIARIHDLTQKVKPSTSMKFIVMGTIGVSNPDGSDDRRPFSERSILFMLRHLLPPQADNEMAAKYVYSDIGENDPYLKWVVVRPDELIDGEVSDYDLFSKPQKGLFGGGQSTRSNVADFMVNLILSKDVWEEWECKMPVIMNTPIVSTTK